MAIASPVSAQSVSTATSGQSAQLMLQASSPESSCHHGRVTKPKPCSVAAACDMVIQHHLIVLLSVKLAAGGVISGAGNGRIHSQDFTVSLVLEQQSQALIRDDLATKKGWAGDKKISSANGCNSGSASGIRTARQHCMRVMCCMVVVRHHQHKVVLWQ